MNILPPHRVLVDLDCFLDTRLGCLSQFNDTLAAQVVKNGTYHTRLRDEFPGMPYEQFKVLCQKRNVETLKNSFLTNIFEFLQLLVRTRLEECNAANVIFNMEMIVNTYPYDLGEAETQALVDIVAARLGGGVVVKAERHPDGYLTPKFCKENFMVMVRYWWEEWVSAQMTNFETVTMPGVSFFVPALYHKPPTQEDLDECERLKLQPFEMSEKAFAPLFGLRLLDVRLFSILDVQAA